MSKTTARLCVLAAVVLWSSSGFFAKSHFFDNWPIEWRGAMFGFWRAVAATCVLLPAVRRVRFRPMLIPMVLSFAGMNITFLSAMVQTTAANAIWLESTAPFWVLLASVFIFRERLRKREFVPFIAAFLGVGLILGFELTHAAGTSRMGVIWGLLSGVCYGGVLVTIRQLREENHAWLVALNHAAAALVLAPVVLGLGYWPHLFQLFWLIAFGVFQMALPYVLLTIGLRTIPSHEAALIGLVEPILNPIWALLVWGEYPAWWTFAGAGFILVGLGLRYAVWEIPAGSEQIATTLCEDSDSPECNKKPQQDTGV